jgi:hypothetical protein
MARRLWRFSHSKSQINKVIDYIDNQESHKKKLTFKEEYLDFLKNFLIMMRNF